MTSSGLRRLTRELQDPQGPRFQQQRDRIGAAFGALSTRSRSNLTAWIRNGIDDRAPTAAAWRAMVAVAVKPTARRIEDLEETVTRLLPADRRQLQVELSRAVDADMPRRHLWIRVKALVEAIQRANG